MEIEIIEMAERKAKFILKNSSPAMANALRRTMMSDIPKMAIDKVEFHLGPIEADGKEYESITPLFDEIIAHRLGMVPVPTDLELFTYQEQCVCNGDGCPNCMIMYSLNENGPGTVLSGNMVPLGNPELKVKDEFIPIVELTGDQAVLIYAIAVMGTAKKHVKWQVTSGVGYKYLPMITIDPMRASSEGALNCVKICPKDVFGIDDGKLVVEHSIECTLCKSCMDSVNNDGSIIVKGDENNFLFVFETDGSLTAEQTLNKAAEILSQKASDLAIEFAQLA
ncbi:MAG TPA: DNA-directed RNA polymerase subunit D [Candidatus Methanomethylophilaceae archaeon]|nr:DNA-directed RNA polymerase subunit D [Candidatus Methanomethylophilaceae archaeon]